MLDVYTNTCILSYCTLQLICVDLLCYICYTFDYLYYWLCCTSFWRRSGSVYLGIIYMLHFVVNTSIF